MKRNIVALIVLPILFAIVSAEIGELLAQSNDSQNLEQIIQRLDRHAPEADCTQVVTENEWRALYALTHKTRTFPKKTPTVA